jgi:RNA polymerase sigma-70 factor (sigma-E family)
VKFTDYVTANQRTLLRFAMALTGDARLAEDVVQDSLARAFQRWDRISVLDRPHAYVRRMIVNEYLSWRRRWSRVQPLADIEPDEVQPDHAVEHAERETMIARLARLPRKQRAVLALRFYEGMSDAEIAETLGCAVGTVRGDASRALAALRVDPPGDLDAHPHLTIREVTR